MLGQQPNNPWARRASPHRNRKTITGGHYGIVSAAGRRTTVVTHLARSGLIFLRRKVTAMQIAQAAYSPAIHMAVDAAMKLPAFDDDPGFVERIDDLHQASQRGRAFKPIPHGLPGMI